MKKLTSLLIFLGVFLILNIQDAYALEVVDTLPVAPYNDFDDVYTYEYDGDTITLEWISDTGIEFCVNNACRLQQVNVNKTNVIWLIAKYSGGYELGYTDVGNNNTMYWYTDGQYSTSQSCINDADSCYQIGQNYIYYKYYVYNSGMWSIYNTILYNGNSFTDKMSSLWYNDNIYIIGSNVPVIFVNEWPPNTNNLHRYNWYMFTNEVAPLSITLTQNKAYDVNNEYSYTYSNSVILNYNEFYPTVCTYTDIDGQTKTKTYDLQADIIYTFDVYKNTTITCNMYTSTSHSELVHTATATVDTINSLNVVDIMNTSLTNESLYSISVDYEYYHDAIARVIPFKVEKLGNGNDTFIKGFDFYLINPNGRHFPVDDIQVLNYNCNTSGNYTVCTGLIKQPGEYTHIGVDILLTDLTGEINIAYYDNLPFTWANRSVLWNTKTFQGFTRYEIPVNTVKMYVYKATSNSTNINYVYFPTTLDIVMKINARYYNADEYEPSLPIAPLDDYYSKIQVDFTNDNILVIGIGDKDYYTQYDGGAYIYVPNDWIIDFYSKQDHNVYLHDDDGNITVIPQEYNNDTSRDISDLFNNVTSYLASISTYTNEYKSLFAYLYNELDNDTKTFLVASFCLLVITGVIILARRF